MKGLILALSLMGSGTAVAATNSEVVANVQQSFKNVAVRLGYTSTTTIDKYACIRESGIPYPSAEYLATVTEDQALQITSAIDVINATYDFSVMTDDEIEIALATIDAELEALYTALGVEAPVSNYVLPTERMNPFDLDAIRADGFPYPPENFLASLTEEQVLAITAKVDEINATYDFSVMTDDELTATLINLRVEMRTLFTDLGIHLPRHRAHQEHQYVSLDIDSVRENGYPYPSDLFLAQLKEEQVLAIQTKVDEINATYDFSVMTDDELTDALATIRAELGSVYADLGINLPGYAEFSDFGRGPGASRPRDGHGHIGPRGGHGGHRGGMNESNGSSVDEGTTTDTTGDDIV